MLVDNKHYKSVWMEGNSVFMINQILLPFKFEIYKSSTYQETCNAIKTMVTRGAGAIGAVAGFAMAQAALSCGKRDYLKYINTAKETIEQTRPTAQDLFFAVEKVYNSALVSPELAYQTAQELANENELAGKKIGEYGEQLISAGMRIETHCNAGWLAFVDYGSALSPIYHAARNNKTPFVFVDETRPRSQGARLTAWELQNENIDHVIIPDNAGAYYMQAKEIDLIIVGADRIASNGDVANKIGTLEKAIAAKYFNIPFYVAAPTSTFDINITQGTQINIEQRSSDEVNFVSGIDKDNNFSTIRYTNPKSKALNPAFDVTPANLVKGIITEKGIIEANSESIKKFLND